LTARECLCRAAGASSVAALLDQEAQAVSATAPRSLLGCRQGDRLADVHQSILRASAAEARNQAAATALELYYRLMEAQRRWQLVQDSLQQLTDALDKSADLERHGLKLPVDAEEFRRQKLQLEADQVQLQVAIERLDGDLRRALGWGAHAGGGPLWPATDFEVCADPMDVHEVVSLGLAGRPELVQLRQLEHQLDGQTLPAVRQLLRASNGLLGGAEQRARPCRPAVLQKVKQCLGADPPDLVARRQQLARYRADREQAIALEIHQAVRAVQGQTQVVFLARARAASWQKKVQELEERRAQGLVSFAETTQTNLEWSRARGDVLQAVTVWQLARVKLKQALGLLVQECSESSGQWSVVSEEQVEYQSPPAAGKRCFPDH
jgi:outer membrane protein TolC